MQELSKIESAEGDVRHTGNAERRERKPWHAPKGTLVEVATHTKGPSGPAGDGFNSCQS